LTTSKKDVRDWLFRGLMFEADAEQFRRAGIRVGVDQREVEQSLFEEVLSPFGVDLRNDALSMSRLYALVYCFENSVRALITERLSERHGVDWWNTKIPRRVREFAEQRIKDAEDNSWLEGQSKDPLGFVQFGHLSDMICENWGDFSDLIPSQQSFNASRCTSTTGTVRLASKPHLTRRCRGRCAIKPRRAPDLERWAP
jgi:hypothetical protein